MLIKILLVAYLIIVILASLWVWAAMVLAKRMDQTMGQDSGASDERPEKTTSAPVRERPTVPTR